MFGFSPVLNTNVYTFKISPDSKISFILINIKQEVGDKDWDVEGESFKKFQNWRSCQCEDISWN